MARAPVLKFTGVVGAGADDSGQVLHIVVRGASGNETYLELPIEAAPALIEGVAIAMGASAINLTKAAGDAIYDPQQLFHFYETDSYVVSPMTEIGRVGVGFDLQHNGRLGFGITLDRAREIADDLYETAATGEKGSGGRRKGRTS